MYKELSAQSSASPSRMALAAGERVVPADTAARRPGKCLGHHKGLAEKALQTPGSFHDQPIRGAQFLHPQEGDDILQVLEAGQRLARAFGKAVVLFAN
jgi:hypothetical protein